MIQGGDDRRVVVWNVEKCVYGNGSPVIMKGEHRSNIFCTVFDIENRHIFSAGNDNQALRHDFSTGEIIGTYYHDDPVYGLNVHPEDSNVFLTASDDGKVLLWDIRSSPLSGSSSCIAQHESAFHAAVFNPVDCSLIATANSRKGVQLWDIRAPISCLKQFSNGMPQMCAMGLKWNRTGDMITALRRRLPPVLYHIKHSAAIAEFHHPGYSNVCTMKSNCFAGSKDQYIVSGSDDFNVYIWEVPADEWGDQGKLITVGRAFLVLHGHRSIVNQVRFNAATHMLISAGVEKVLKVWSPFPIPGGHSSVDVCPGNARQLYSHSDYLGFIRYGGLPLSHDEYNSRSTDEDPRMLAFFDSLIQREKDSFQSDSDDSVWDDFHLSFILQAGSSEGSDSDTVGTSVSRLLAREILHRPGQGSPDREAGANSSVLRRLRHLRDAAVIRDLLNADSSSDEETRNNTRTAMNEPNVDVDQNRQSSTHSPVTFIRHRHRANRRYRFHNRLRSENERRQVANDSSSTDSEDKITLQRRKSKTDEDNSSVSDGDTEDIRQNVNSSSDEAKQEERENILQEINGQSSAAGLETSAIACKTNEESVPTITNRANGNTQTTCNHKNEWTMPLRTDLSSSCENNQYVTAESLEHVPNGKDCTSFREEKQSVSDDNE